MNSENYLNIKISGTFGSANWQNFVDLFRELYNPLSLRTFKGSSSPAIIDSYTRVHWDDGKDKEGFGTSIIKNTDIWDNFEFSFYDKDDEFRFINIKINPKQKTIEFLSSFDNRKKLEDALIKIQNTFININWKQKPIFENKDIQSNSDILDIKPNFYGIGINLNEVWKRLKNILKKYF